MNGARRVASTLRVARRGGIDDGSGAWGPGDAAAGGPPIGPQINRMAANNLGDLRMVRVNAIGGVEGPVARPNPPAALAPVNLVRPVAPPAALLPPPPHVHPSYISFDPEDNFRTIEHIPFGKIFFRLGVVAGATVLGVKLRKKRKRRRAAKAAQAAKDEKAAKNPST
jgi:hypothetical protein